MKRLESGAGYTIVEVMIFLIITGALLIVGWTAFSGRQQKTRFTQSVREVEAELRTTINETASGHYPNRGELECTSSGGTGPELSTVPEGTVNQGSNAGCIFLGKVVQFTTGESYYIYTVVGQRVGQNGQEVTALGTGNDQAKQRAVVPSDEADQGDAPDITVIKKMPGGLRVTKVATSSADFSSIGFITSFGRYNGSDPVSGTGSLNLYALAALNITDDEVATEARNTSMAEYVHDQLADGPINPGRTTICLQETSTGGRKAAIYIGASGNNTGTEVVIDGVPAECE